MVFGTVGTDNCSVIGMEVVAGREPGCWVGKGLGGGVLVRSRGGLMVRIRNWCE